MADDESWRRRRVEELAAGRPPTWSVQPTLPAAVPPPVNARPSPTPPVSPGPARPEARQTMPSASHTMRHRSSIKRLPVERLVLLGGAALLLVAGSATVLSDRLGPAAAPDSAPTLGSVAPAPRQTGARAPLPRPDVAAPAPVAVAAAVGTPAASQPASAVAREAPVARRQHARPRVAEIELAAETAAVRHPALRRPARSVALPGRGFRPSFNCRRARASVNRVVCDNAELARLDRQMSADYFAAVRGVDRDTERRIDRDQTEFLNLRGRCNGVACIADSYRERIDQLEQASR